jgi:hypothetical protein
VVPSIVTKPAENSEDPINTGRTTRLSSLPDGTQIRQSRPKKVLHWDAHSDELDALDEHSFDEGGDFDEEDAGDGSTDSNSSQEDDGELSSEEWGATKRKRAKASRSRSKSNGNEDLVDDSGKKARKKQSAKRNPKKSAESENESGSIKMKDSRAKKKDSDLQDHIDADDTGEWDESAGVGAETVQETKSPWNQLQAPLPLSSLPSLSHCDISDSKSTHFSTLIQVDTTAPILEPLNSATVWKKSTISKAPVATPNSQAADTTSKIHVLKHPSETITGNATQRKTTPFISTPSVISARLSLSSSSAAVLKNKKKRKRSSPEEEDGAEQEENQGGDETGEMRLQPGITEAKKRGAKKTTKIIQTLDIDAEMEEEWAQKRAKIAEADSTPPPSEIETPGRSLSSAAKRRMSKGDELVVVRRDAEGRVMMPLTFGAIVVESLGTVDFQNDKFHSKRYIFPVGYISKRLYFSLKRPDQRCWYTQEILASPNDPKEPLFRLVCEDDPNSPIEGSTPSGVWTEVLERVRPFREAAAGRKLFSTVSGPEQFGLSHGVIHKLIQELPNADKCANYDPSLIETKQSKSKKGES